MTLPPDRSEVIERAVDAFRDLVSGLIAAATPVTDLRDELTIGEVAESLKCSPSTIKSLCGMRGGEVRLSYFKRQNRVYILRRDVEAYRAQVQLRTSVMRSPARRRE